MAAFTHTTLEPRLDTIAFMRAAMLAASGSLDYLNETGSFRYGINKLNTDVNTLADLDISADLQPSVRYLADNLTNHLIAAYDQELIGLIAGMNANLGTDLDAQIASFVLSFGGNRISGHIADILRSIGAPVTPDNYWAPEGYRWGRYHITGASTGTYARIQDLVDSSSAAVASAAVKAGDYLYGGTLLKAIAETSVTSVVIDVTGIDETGAVRVFSGTLVGTAGTEVDLVSTPAHKCFSVTSIAIAGGGAAEYFRIEALGDRVITLLRSDHGQNRVYLPGRWRALH